VRRSDGGARGALVVAVARTVPWRAVGAGAVVGLLVVGLPRLSGPLAAWLGLPLLRAAALVFALGLTFLLDDPARRLTTPVPTRRWVRSGLRVALVAPVAALWWTAALALVPAPARPPIGAVTLEAAATAVLAVAAAAVAVRCTDEPEPGPSVAAGFLTLGLLAPAPPPHPLESVRRGGRSELAGGPRGMGRGPGRRGPTGSSLHTGTHPQPQSARGAGAVRGLGAGRPGTSAVRGSVWRRAVIVPGSDRALAPGLRGRRGRARVRGARCRCRIGPGVGTSDGVGFGRGPEPGPGRRRCRIASGAQTVRMSVRCRFRPGVGM